MRTNFIKVMSLALLINTSFGTDGMQEENGMQEEERISSTSRAPLSRLTQEQLDTSLMYNSYSGDMDIVKRCLEKGANINVLDAYHENALFKAVYSGFNKLSIFLIEQDIDLNVINSTSHSCLSYACLYSSDEVIEKLVMYGADIIATNNHGIKFNALHHCKNEELVTRLTRYKSRR